MWNLHGVRSVSMTTDKSADWTQTDSQGNESTHTVGGNSGLGVNLSGSPGLVIHDIGRGLIAGHDAVHGQHSEGGRGRAEGALQGRGVDDLEGHVKSRIISVTSCLPRVRVRRR
jgi:hypothetical protein